MTPAASASPPTVCVNVLYKTSENIWKYIAANGRHVKDITFKVFTAELENKSSVSQYTSISTL